MYRPEDKLENLPVIMMWTPYGKRHWHGTKETPGLHQAMGVPRGTIFKRAVFEGADPGYWCHQGYCIVNVDAPGCGYSEGVNNFMHVAEGGQDGKEVIDWIGEQSWCNGRVGMAGNSGLAMVQWYIAAAKPEHLVCIAPWEGTIDVYRENLCVGGIPAPAFCELTWYDFRGPEPQHDPMYVAEQTGWLFNEYFEDMTSQVENIKIPVYACAGWSHPTHLRGSLEAFRRIKSRNKWLRVHRDFEWPDFNSPENIADLQRFFDRYLKNINNGWEMTPKVRLEVLDAYDYNFRHNRPEDDFPIPRTQYKRLYLDAASMSMQEEPVAASSQVSYDSQTGDVSFTFTCEEETELTGHFVFHTWIASETDDADVFVLVQKNGVDGEPLPTTIFGVPDPGAHGQLRASLRELDEEKSTSFLPQYTFNNPQPLTPGEPTELTIEVWPQSRIWHKGESIVVNIAGRPIRDKSWFSPTACNSINAGAHTIYTGGAYDTYLQVPVVPPKHKSGDFEVR